MALKYKLAAVDIDGTLVDPSGKLTEPVKAAVRAAVAQGLHFVLTTGRRYRTSIGFAREIGIDGHVISNHGTIIKETRADRTVWRAELSQPLAVELIDILADEGLEPLVFVDAYEEGVDFLVLAGPERGGTVEFTAIHRGAWRRAGKSDIAGQPIVEVGAFDDWESCGRAAKRIAERFGVVGAHETLSRDNLSRDKTKTGAFLGDCPAFCASCRKKGTIPLSSEEKFVAAGDPARPDAEIKFHVIKSPSYSYPCVEVISFRAGKGSALLALAERLGVAPEETAAIGDDINDLDMFARSGLAIAMGNASDAVKSRAALVVPPNSQDGIIEALKAIGVLL